MGNRHEAKLSAAKKSDRSIADGGLPRMKDGKKYRRDGCGMNGTAGAKRCTRGRRAP